MEEQETSPMQTGHHSHERKLIKMYLPVFRQGYEDGRKHFFERKEPAAYAMPEDVLFIEHLKLMIEDWNTSHNEEDLHYGIGDLLGWICAHHIPQGEGVGKLIVSIDEHGVQAYGRCSECNKPLRFP